MWKPHKRIRARWSSCSGLIRLCALPAGRQRQPNGSAAFEGSCQSQKQLRLKHGVRGAYRNSGHFDCKPGL